MCRALWRSGRAREGEGEGGIPAWAVRRVPVKVPMPMLGTRSPVRSVIFGSCRAVGGGQRPRGGQAEGEERAWGEREEGRKKRRGCGSFRYAIPLQHVRTHTHTHTQSYTHSHTRTHTHASLSLSYVWGRRPDFDVGRCCVCPAQVHPEGRHQRRRAPQHAGCKRHPRLRHREEGEGEGEEKRESKGRESGKW